MLYYLFDWLHNNDVPGTGVYKYISFRAAAAVILSLFISMIIGKYVIKSLKNKQVGESVRDLGLKGQVEKTGTPTMGGLIIIASILIPVLLLTNLSNVYILLMIFTTLWLGFIGFTDDYIKVFKKNKKGLSGKFKILGQIILGLVVGVVMYYSTHIVIKEKCVAQSSVSTEAMFQFDNSEKVSAYSCNEAHRSTKTTIPFIKNNEFDYAWISKLFGDSQGRWTVLFFVLVVVFIITAVSNGANLTDGLDGLATGTSAVIGIGLGILAYVSGNAVFADYLNIMYIPHTGDLVVYMAAFVGACIGFYWWNCYPASVFMGDTGSLTLGGIIAVFCILIRKELLIPILCGVFFIQTLSVMIQVGYFKYTKKRYGEGRRIFLMSPLHHHYQKKGFHEAKIVQRFIIVGIMLAVFAIVTLKLR